MLFFYMPISNHTPRKRRRLTKEQTARHRERSIQAMRAARALHTPEQAEHRRRANRENMRAARARESPQQAYLRREADNGATKVQRRIVPAGYSAASSPAYVDIGNMDVKCRNCNALRFLAERNIGSSDINPVFSICCQGGKLTFQNFSLLHDPPPLSASVGQWVNSSL